MATTTLDITNLPYSDKYETYTTYADAEFCTVDKNKVITLRGSYSIFTQEENSQYLPFQMLRHYDGIDLMDMSIMAHLLLPNKSETYIVPVNVQYDDDYIYFGIILTAVTTALSGVLKMELQAIGTNEAGNEYKLVTRSAAFTVEESLLGEGEASDPGHEWTVTFINQVNELLTNAQTAATEATEAATAAEAALDTINLTELTDIRTGYDGTAYDTAGNAVREQIEEVHAEIDKVRQYIGGTHTLTTWAEISLAATTGIASSVYSVGDEITDTWTIESGTAYSDPWVVQDFATGTLEDGTSIEGMWLARKYATAYGIPFKHQQAFYVADNGLSAGTYYVTFGYSWGNNGYVNSGDIWHFTLTSDVPTGGKLAGFYGAPDQAQTSWHVYVYSADGKTLLETADVASGESGTSLGTLTAYGEGESGTLNGLQQTAYGSNRWDLSDMRQWLNSSAGVGEWWTPQTKWDIAPSELSTRAGYLAGMDEELLAVLKPIKVTTFYNTVSPDEKVLTSVDTYDKVTLPSLEQIYAVPQISGEGDALAYYEQLNGTGTRYAQHTIYPELIHYAVNSTASPQYVRLRSAYRGNASHVWLVFTAGYVGNTNASYVMRAAPLIFV